MLSKKILYVMNADPDNIKVLGQVIKFAGERRASVTVLDVIDSLPPTSRMLITSVPAGDLRDSLVRSRLDQLETLIARLGSDAVELRPRVLFGKHAKQIVSEANDGGYDLVIKSPESGGADRYLLKHCHCPVWLLLPGDYDAAGQLLPSHGPELAVANDTLPPRFSPPTGSGHRTGWFSRAQALFR